MEKCTICGRNIPDIEISVTLVLGGTPVRICRNEIISWYETQLRMENENKKPE